jgi:hypothetical protein
MRFASEGVGSWRMVNWRGWSSKPESVPHGLDEDLAKPSSKPTVWLASEIEVKRPMAANRPPEAERRGSQPGPPNNAPLFGVARTAPDCKCISLILLILIFRG